ncbi:MAG: hypothetical protein SFV52_12900 [Saprospiraceae bacterium]|nr:hypothetical protein [Saprospiraceae bacterium]
MDKTYAESCHRYLYGRMSAAEIESFEQALRNEPARQKAYIDFMLSEQANPYYNDEQLRAIAGAVRVDTGPMPHPALNLWDRLWLFWARNPLLTIGFATLLVAGLVWVTRTAWDRADLTEVQKHMINPFCLSVAGSDPAPVDHEAVTKRASDFYCGVSSGGRDSLVALVSACDSFCMASYYLAHWDLRAGDYSAARGGLDQCLQNQAFIRQAAYNRSIGTLKLNLLLAELGESPARRSDLYRTLSDMVKNDPDFQGQLNEEAREKAEELLHRLIH